MDSKKKDSTSFQEHKVCISKTSLFITLSLFQIVSLTTTVNGTRILLGHLDPLGIGSFKLPAYLFFGVGIQLFILWLFVLGEYALRSRFILWLLVLVYTLLSIYTSFFSLYEGISQKDLSRRTSALEQSDKIVLLIQGNENYKNQYKSYLTIEEEIKNAKKASEDYCTTCRDAKKQQLDDNITKLNLYKADLVRIGEFDDYTKNRENNFSKSEAEKIYEENKRIILRTA